MYYSLMPMITEIRGVLENNKKFSEIIVLIDKTTDSSDILCLVLKNSLHLVFDESVEHYIFKKVKFNNTYANDSELLNKFANMLSTDKYISDIIKYYNISDNNIVKSTQYIKYIVNSNKRIESGEQLYESLINEFSNLLVDLLKKELHGTKINWFNNDTKYVVNHAVNLLHKILFMDKYNKNNKNDKNELNNEL